MRKIVIILLIALLASTSLFSTAVSKGINDLFPGNKDSDTVVVDVKLLVTPEDMYYYAFGFSNEVGDVALSDDQRSALPEVVNNNLRLVYDASTSTASNKDPLYLFYKARTGIPFNVILTMNGNMKPSTANAPELGWFVNIKSIDFNGSESSSFNASTIDSDNNGSAYVRINSSNSEAKYGSYAIEAHTDTIPLIDEKTDYTGSLTITVSTAS